MASALDRTFQTAVDAIRNAPTDLATPSQTTQLQFYASYKQATKHDAPTTSPAWFRFTDRAKWDAWDALRGTTQDQAKTMYVQLTNTHLKRSS